MLGAIIGDIVGSRFEFNNHRSKEFDLFTEDCFFTDDTVMTLAVAKALQESDPDAGDLKENTVKYMQEIGRNYPDCGYGGRFYGWMFSDEPEPYNSFGNGAAMRVSACVDTVSRLDKEEYALLLKRIHCVTAVTHDHPEGLRGAEAVVLAALFARIGKSIEEIKEFMDEHYYRVDFTLDEIRDTYRFNETCQETVPQALAAFYESKDFEDAIRNAISIGGDSDTLAAITGTIAEEYYGIPARLQQTALSYLDDRLLDLYEDYQEALGLKYVEADSLDGGKVLYTIKRMFLDERTPEKLDSLLSCLRDSIVRVPGRAVLSEEDQKRFIEGIKGGVGATFSNEDEVIFEPDILVNDDGERFFPIFCNDEQIPEDYKQNFSIKDIPVFRCIELAKMKDNVNGLVLDPFTEQITIPFEMANIIDRKKSRIKIREDRRELKSDVRFTLNGLSEEEFNEITDSLQVQK